MTAISYYHVVSYGDWIYHGFPFYYYEFVWMGTNVFSFPGLIGDISVWFLVWLVFFCVFAYFKWKRSTNKKEDGK